MYIFSIKPRLFSEFAYKSRKMVIFAWASSPTALLSSLKETSPSPIELNKWKTEAFKSRCGDIVRFLSCKLSCFHDLSWHKLRRALAKCDLHLKNIFYQKRRDDTTSMAVSISQSRKQEHPPNSRIRKSFSISELRQGAELISPKLHR